MKASILFATLALAVLLGAQPKPQTFTGVITDTMCGKDHAHMGVSPDEKCVRECVRASKGKFKYALWDGKKMYVLSDQQAPEKFAAKQVKVTGTLFEKTGIIKVDKMELVTR